MQVYYDLLISFHRTFKRMINKEIEIVELGIGPNGELRYPSSCSTRGWIYPGIGAFQVILDIAVTKY